VLRPQQETAKMLQEAEASLSGFEKPIVGIHVRRTDKVGTEAAFHAVEEYMKYVNFFSLFRSNSLNLNLIYPLFVG
jgi:glycoprotein 6-alpha-L-fucosyltransferase